MVKCEVLADRVSLVVGKGSIVLVDNAQFELARQFIKPIKETAKAEEPKAEEDAEEKKAKKAKKK